MSVRTRDIRGNRSEPAIACGDEILSPRLAHAQLRLEHSTKS
jgi:hypothetical protein